MKAIVTLLLTAAMFFLSLVLSLLIGALCGFIVGLIFGPTILGIFAAIGITGFKMWQIGAFLGFVGGFFRSTTTQTS